MFAPRSTQLPRTYSVYQQPTTSKKNLNKENANGLPSKTPSRAGKSVLGGAGPGTTMRMGLGVKTEGTDRNVLMQQQGGGKGKGKEGEDIEPKRLFGHGPSKPTTSIPPSKSLSSMPHIQATISHQTHKTPARSRKQQFQSLRTPAPAPIQEPAPTPLPSATRQRRRSRQSLSNISLTPIKASIEQSFVTPAPVQWEEELSLGSIEETTNELLTNVQEENEVEEDDDGEPEYMPPPVQELPYTPAYDHPDIVSIFSTLQTLPPMWSYHDDVIIKKVPEFQFDEVEIQGISLTGDDDLEEEWLRPITPKTAQPAQPKTNTINRTKIASGRGVPSTMSKFTRPITQPTTSSRSVPASRTPLPSSRLPSNPLNKTRPPAPVPRPPPIRQTVPTRPMINGKQPSSRPPLQVKTKKVVEISEEDKKLFEMWDKEDSLITGQEFELNLDLNLDTLKADGAEVKMSYHELKISD